ncbi:MAG: OsmC family protein [Cocleimonas sp.]
MNIKVLGQTELRLSRFDSDELNVNLANKAIRYSAIAMFVTSIARCTFAVLDQYAKRMEITTKNIVTELSWDFLEDPTRINQINMKIIWPELLDKRIASVERASHKCTISTTIKDCIQINTSVSN